MEDKALRDGLLKLLMELKKAKLELRAVNKMLDRVAKGE